MNDGGRQALHGGAEAGACYVKVYGFMGSALGLAGLELPVSARISGFTIDGLPFYESRTSTAEFFGCSRRAVITAVGRLVEKGLIFESAPGSKVGAANTKEYFADLNHVFRMTGIEVRPNCADGEVPSPSGTAMSEGGSPLPSEDFSPDEVNDVHPIPKRKEKR